jgi:hypothetical protein
MAALTVFEKQSGEKLAMGLSLQWFSLVFLVPALHLATRPDQIAQAREGLLWAGGLVTMGWLLQQWEAGRWPLQARFTALWATRVGNLCLSLLLAAALTALALLAINATLGLNRFL